MNNPLEKLFGKFSFIPYRGAKAAQVDPEIFSHLELHIAAHPDIETSCVLANLFRAIYMDSGLFYAESLERLDATSRALARDLMRAKLLKAFPQEEWDEAHRLISQLPPERGGIGLSEPSAAAATSAFAEKSAAPSPAIGSLAWVKAWVKYFKWMTRRRAATAFAFAQHGGFEGFKYLWGAPAAAAVIGAFFGIVLLDEKLGLRRIIISSPPVQWIAELGGVESTGDEAQPMADTGPMLLAKTDKSSLTRSQPDAQSGGGQVEESATTVALNPVSEEEPQQQQSAGAAPDPEATAPASTLAVKERPTPVALSIRNDRPASRPAVPKRAVSPLVGKPPLPQKAPAPTTPPIAEIPPEPSIPPITPDPVTPPAISDPPLVAAVVDKVKDVANDVAGATPRKEEVGELLENAPIEVEQAPAQTVPDLIQRLQGGGSTARPEGKSPVERVARPVVETVKVERVARPVVETGKPVERVVRPTVDQVQRSLVERPAVERVQRSVVERPQHIERPSVERVERPVERLVKPVERIIKPELGLKR